MNHNLKFEPEEKELLDSYELDEWQSVGELQEQLHQYQTYAAATLEDAGLISLDLSPEDVDAIRQKATAARMSYQAFITNILHRYVTGQIVEQSRLA